MVMARACITATFKGSLLLIDDVTHNGRSIIHSQVYRNIQAVDLQRNASNLLKGTLLCSRTMTENNGNES